MQERDLLQQVRGTSSSSSNVGYQVQIGHKGTWNDPPIQVQGEHSYLTVSRVLRGGSPSEFFLHTPCSWTGENVSSAHCTIFSQPLGHKTSHLHFLSPPSFPLPSRLSSHGPSIFLVLSHCLPKSPIILVSVCIHWKREMRWSCKCEGAIYKFQTSRKGNNYPLCIALVLLCWVSSLSPSWIPFPRFSFVILV